MDQQTYEEVKASIQEDRKRPAIDRYREMVASGLIDAGGKVLVGRRSTSKAVKSFRTVYARIKSPDGNGYKVIGPVKVKKKPSR